MTPLFSPTPAAPVQAQRSDAVTAAVSELHGRTVSWFRLEGGKHRGAIGVAESEALERAVRLGIELGMPVVGAVSTSGADVSEGVASLHAAGRVALALSDASGIVPTLLAVVGPCVSGPALVLGLVDQVVMTSDAFAYVSGPDTASEFTGVPVSPVDLGGAAVHDLRSGVAAVVVDDDADALAALATILDYLPDHHLDDPPWLPDPDPVDRDCTRAAAAVPDASSASYDVRDVISDVVDAGTLFELRARHAPNLVTALARIGGRPIGVLANQPSQRAGTLDIDASRKGARFVQWCDAFNVPLVTFVDTPGFEPGTDLEWRGMIRHGAQLVHAYAAATVPRLCVALRKAYGGAYIVMDSKTLGNDWYCAWPSAEIAVMGARGAVQILHGKRLRAMYDEQARQAEQVALEREYDARFLSPYPAEERGYVDEIITPRDTRRALAAALERFRTKREARPARRHSNSPL
ncbi:MAG TPA: carboxyl transferase domain-containing protein [Acidimicrobiia bacterium]|nr:carboxyl transferase domain-containing protein [Acidimicrobiia bacterium]